MSTPTISGAAQAGVPERPAEPGIRPALRLFIEARMPGVAFGDEQDIFSLGIINSLFALELVLFIEKTTGTRVPNEELTMDHFRSIEAMTALAARISDGPGAKAGS